MKFSIKKLLLLEFLKQLILYSHYINRYLLLKHSRKNMVKHI
jgi:hypothetical protein